MSCDLLPSESCEDKGVHYQGDGRRLAHARRWDTVVTFMPCEQQTLSLGALAPVKALDGRMWWGLAQWLYFWCAPAAVVWAEQPDVYVADFYDAPHIVTSPSEWGGTWQKRTLLFYRGSSKPRPPAPGAKGDCSWHNAGSLEGTERAHFRDETADGLAAGIAQQAKPTAHAHAGTGGYALSYAVEVERMAA
eukprot:6204263-Pleurochrysis_carterae.AAC.1